MMLQAIIEGSVRNKFLVVLVTLALVTGLIAGLDFLFGEGVIQLLRL